MSTDTLTKTSTENNVKILSLFFVKVNNVQAYVVCGNVTSKLIGEKYFFHNISLASKKKNQILKM